MGRTGTLLFIPFITFFIGFFVLLGYQIYRGDKRVKREATRAKTHKKTVTNQREKLTNK